MSDLPSGLYEQVVSKDLAEQLSSLPPEQKSLRGIDKAEGAKVLTSYLTPILENYLALVGAQAGKDSLAAQIEAVNRILSTLPSSSGLSVDKDGSELLAILTGEQVLSRNAPASELPRPISSMAETTLFTGAAREPHLGSELSKELESATSCDLLISFVKWGGLVLLMPALRAFCNRGGHLRLITTTYMGATDARAVEEISKLPNTQIRVSYDIKSTRLHAKAYIFKRDTGYHTAYVGSSNLSKAAVTDGLEWNLKLSAKDQPETMAKILATFESYWASPEFTLYDGASSADQERLRSSLQAAGLSPVPGTSGKVRTFFDLQPYAFQQQILDALEADRCVRHEYRNLIVAATGTGKTMIAAFDYRRFRQEHKRARLLFVAHREEILTQARYTFQEVLKDANFGQLLVGAYEPDSMDDLFASIQSVNAKSLTNLPADYYDYIVIDEFHHAAAPTYQALLAHFKPQILLGLTATPERMDGKSITDYFGGRISAEIRLPEAIERQLLCPFHYFGVTDPVSLAGMTWTRGGYEVKELNNVYVYDQAVAKKRADLVIQAVTTYASDLSGVKGLGFCVSVEHARFMAQCFNDAGIPSISLSAQSPDDERESAKKRLTSGELKFIFVVDLYNEGVDIPSVNMVLFLRPTQSLTIFLQQLGRGLRLCPGKGYLTVLDFIGQANRHYNFAQKFEALLSNHHKNMTQEIKEHFQSLPTGCYLQLEPIAEEYVLENVKHAVNTVSGLVQKIKTFTEDTGLPCTFRNFLSWYGMDPEQIYVRGQSFTRLCATAGVIPSFDLEPAEKDLTTAMAKFALIDSRRWIAFLQALIQRLESGLSITLSAYSPVEKREFEMFWETVFRTYAKDGAELQEKLSLLRRSPRHLKELSELLSIRYEAIDIVDESVDPGFDCPLDLHCSYTRDQLFSAMDYETPGNIREGVKWLPDHKIDVLLITLNKSDKDFSPSTMYSDYSLNENLFHWQSQSTTSADSATGQRYIHHREQGSQVAIFVREYKTDVYGQAGAYTYLGLAEYVSHEGSKPMSIIWRLQKPIPAKYLKKTSQLAG